MYTGCTLINHFVVVVVVCYEIMPETQIPIKTFGLGIENTAPCWTSLNKRTIQAWNSRSDLRKTTCVLGQNYLRTLIAIILLA